jgi:hypothetical protein
VLNKIHNEVFALSVSLAYLGLRRDVALGSDHRSKLD